MNLTVSGAVMTSGKAASTCVPAFMYVILVCCQLIDCLMMQRTGDITYNGAQLSEFVPERTSAYVTQFDNVSACINMRHVSTASCCG